MLLRGAKDDEKYHFKELIMICQKCGTSLNENDSICPSCNTPVNEETQPTVSNEQNAETYELTQKKRGIFAKLKDKLHLKSIFDDTIPRSPLERKISSKYFVILICSFFSAALDADALTCSIDLTKVAKVFFI